MALPASAHVGRDAWHSSVDDVHVGPHSAAEHAPGAVPDRADEDVPILLAILDRRRRRTLIPLHFHEPLQVADPQLAHLGRYHCLQRLRP